MIDFPSSRIFKSLNTDLKIKQCYNYYLELT